MAISVKSNSVFINIKLSRLGALLWVASAQYYVVQFFIWAYWPAGFYSWAHNTISDMGNTACADYAGRFVCSPNSLAMNLSFIILGITQLLGALLLMKQYAAKIVRLGFMAMIAAGVGTILVGLFPENSIAWLHVLGAALPFLVGSVGLVSLGYGLRDDAFWIARLATVFGVISLIALALFVTKNYLALGIGGMERVVAYPQTIWMMIFGTYILLSTRQKSSRT